MLLHSTEVYAKKTLLNTAMSGTSPLHHQLEACQQQWAAFTTAVADAKDRLESSFLRWSDVDSATVQLANWMSEVDKRSQMAPVTSLAEKKAQFHKMKASEN